MSKFPSFISDHIKNVLNKSDLLLNTIHFYELTTQVVSSQYSDNRVEKRLLGNSLCPVQLRWQPRNLWLMNYVCLSWSIPFAHPGLHASCKLVAKGTIYKYAVPLGHWCPINPSSSLQKVDWRMRTESLIIIHLMSTKGIRSIVQDVLFWSMYHVFLKKDLNILWESLFRWKNSSLCRKIAT